MKEVRWLLRDPYRPANIIAIAVFGALFPVPERIGAILMYFMVSTMAWVALKVLDGFPRAEE